MPKKLKIICGKQKVSVKPFDILSQLIFLSLFVSYSFSKCIKVRPIFNNGLFFVPMKHNKDKYRRVSFNERKKSGQRQKCLPEIYRGKMKPDENNKHT